MTELTYTLHDDLLFSCMELTEEEQMPLGKYGRMKLQYLNEQRPGLFARLLLSGQLMHQLHEVDRTALRRMDILLPQMVRVAIQNFLKNPVISMVFGHPNRKISCISPHIRAAVLKQPPFFYP